MNKAGGQLDEQQYIEQRVNDQLAYYATAANNAKRKYTWIQTSVIVLGVMVPVAINIPTALNGGVNIEMPIRIAVTIMSLGIAILNGLLNFRKYGDLWLSYRMTEELLKNEKFFFLTATGQYREQESAFPRFVQTVETLISSEHDKFRSLITRVKNNSHSADAEEVAVTASHAVSEKETSS